MKPRLAALSEGIPKTDSSLFDVFLSHNNNDKPSVRQLAWALVQRGIKVWLDEWELIPGRNWLSALEKMIETIPSAIVLIGEDGLGPWEDKEMRACIAQLVEREMPVIPVLLPNARAKPDLPLFLCDLTWVDLREEGLTEEKIDKLIWGITGVKPTSTDPSPPVVANSSHPLDEAAQTAIRSLAELIKTRPVWGPEVHFTEEFRAVRDQVTKLCDYKDLHDHLQDVEHSCQNLVAHQVRLSDADRIDWELLDSAEMALQRVVEVLQDLQRNHCLSSAETTWINDLNSVWAELQRAIKNRDPKSLKNVAWRLGRLLRIELPRINTRLNEVARNLRLSTLVNVMKDVADNLSASAQCEVSILYFKQGIDALLRLSQTLMLLVAQHDDWQRIDQELRLIEANLDRDTQEIEMAWPNLMHRVEALYDVITTDWVVLVRRDARELDQVIATADPSLVRECFRKFRRQVSIRFYRVDLQLKDLCENLRQIDSPLGSLLMEIQ